MFHTAGQILVMREVTADDSIYYIREPGEARVAFFKLCDDWEEAEERPQGTGGDACLLFWIAKPSSGCGHLETQAVRRSDAELPPAALSTSGPRVGSELQRVGSSPSSVTNPRSLVTFCHPSCPGFCNWNKGDDNYSAWFTQRLGGSLKLLDLF